MLLLRKTTGYLGVGPTVIRAGKNMGELGKKDIGMMRIEDSGVTQYPLGG